jgi:hypothetical protein
LGGFTGGSTIIKLNANIGNHYTDINGGQTTLTPAPDNKAYQAATDDIFCIAGRSVTATGSTTRTPPRIALVRGTAAGGLPNRSGHENAASPEIIDMLFDDSHVVERARHIMITAPFNSPDRAVQPTNMASATNKLATVWPPVSDSQLATNDLDESFPNDAIFASIAGSLSAHGGRTLQSRAHGLRLQ